MTRKNATELLLQNEEGIARAVQILSAGDLVALPTETVYGLAARADSSEAVAKIFEAKGRPSFNPLIVHVKNLEQAERLGHFDSRARDLAAKFWPGPLTLVLPVKDGARLAPAICAGLATIALRQPAHPVMLGLLGAVDFPLAAPSANRSESISPTRPEHVMASLGKSCPAIFDGGAAQAGLESTIVALRADGGWSHLRPGPLSKETLEKVLGPEAKAQGGKIEAPGQLARHYSPGKPMRLNASEVAQDEFWIGFGAFSGEINLSQSGELDEAAANLYNCLHIAAASKQSRIAVAPIPRQGIGRAINDRLRRAATI